MYMDRGGYLVDLNRGLRASLGLTCDQAFDLRFNLRSGCLKVDNAICQINHYPADSVVRFVNTYPLESD